MSDDFSAAPVEPLVSPVDPSGRWVPGEKERALLLGAAVCSLLASGMTAFGAWVGMRRGQPEEGFTLSMGLELAAIIPQVVIVVCIGTMAEQTKSRGLHVSAGCFYGCGWLLALLVLSFAEFTPQWLRIVLWVIVGLGILAIIGFVGEKYKGFEPAVGVPLLACYFLARFGARALLGVQLGFGDTVLVAAALFLVLGSLAFWVLYGVSLIANRSAFGTLSAVLGVVYLGSLAYFVVVTVQKVVELANQPGINQQAMDEEMNKLTTAYEPSILVLQLVLAMLMALWFLVLRSRSHAMDDMPQEPEQRGIF